MGEYAQQYTLKRFGVDIEDERKADTPKPPKRFGCRCGRVFIDQQARAQHQKDTGHYTAIGDTP